MDKFFFRDKNVAKQVDTLVRQLNIKNNPETKQKCKRLLVKEMQEVYKKYKSRKPEDMKPDKFLDLLNKKSISNCCQIINSRRSSKKPSPDRIHDLERQRDEDIHGRRQNIVERRPRVPNMRQTNRGQQENGMFSSMPDAGAAGFAPIPRGNGGFISATGEMGNEMFFGNLNEQMNNGGRSTSQNELERRMMERQSEYEGRPNQMNGMNGMGMNGMGMNGMDMRTMGYNPNIGNNNGKPPEINFALDGSDTRGYGGPSSNNMKNGMGMNDMNYDMMMSGMGGYDMNMGNMGNFDMNMGNMGNNMGNMGNMNMGNMNMGNMGNMNMGNMGNMGNMNMGNMGNMNMGNMGNMGNNMGNMSNNNDPNMQAMMLMMQQNGMGGNGMGGNSMNMGNNQNYGSNPLSDQELQRKMDEMLRYRDSGIEIPKGGNFNPMVSPNINANSGNNIMNGNFDTNQLLMLQKMSEMNYLNSKGRKSNDRLREGKNLAELSNQELEQQIDEVKRTILQSNFNLEHLNGDIYSLNSEQLGNLIKKMENSMNSDADSDEDIPKKDKKKRKKSKSKRKSKSKDAKEKLHELASHLRMHNQKLEDIDIESSPEKIKKVVKGNKYVEIDDDDDQIYIGSKNAKSPEKKKSMRKVNNSDEFVDSDKITPKLDNPIPVEKSDVKKHTVVIDSSQHSDPDFYSDYFVNLPEEYHNIIGIELVDFDMPKIKNKIEIGEDTNYLAIRMEGDNEIKEMDLDEGSYSVKELLSTINYGFEQLEIDLTIDINNQNIVVIKSNTDKNFSIDSESTLFRLLGFTDKNYSGSNNYISSKKLSKYQSVKLQVDGIADGITGELDSKKQIHKYFKEPIDTLDRFVIKMNNESNEPVDFKRKPHKLTFQILTRN